MPSGKGKVRLTFGRWLCKGPLKGGKGPTELDLKICFSMPHAERKLRGSGGKRVNAKRTICQGEKGGPYEHILQAFFASESLGYKLTEKTRSPPTTKDAIAIERGRKRPRKTCVM